MPFVGRTPWIGGCPGRGGREDETPLDSIPAGGKVGRVETMTRGGATFYEAGYAGKDGKRHAVLVKPDGTETKD
jgi:hypothetical protein